MTEPQLKPGSTWFNTSKCSRSDVKKIIIQNGVTTGNFVSWIISTPETPVAKAYFDATTGILYISTEEYPHIYMNPNSDYLFSNANGSYFVNLESIEGLDLLREDYAENMGHLCTGCAKLKQFNAHTWIAPVCNSLKAAFANCTSLTQIDLFSFYGGNVTTIQSLCGNCSSLKKVDFKTWNLKKCLDMSYAFFRCLSLEYLDIMVPSSCTTLMKFAQSDSKLQYVNTDNWHTENVTNMEFIFTDADSLRTLRLGHLNFGKVKSMKHAFSVSTWPWEPEAGPDELDLSNADFKNCEDFSFMFWGHHRFKKISCRNWDVRKGKNFDHLIAQNVQLTDFDTSLWETPNAENMYAMFHSFSGLVIDVSHFITNKVTVFGQMFENTKCKQIIGHEKFDTAAGISFDEMFARSHVEELDLSGYDTRNAKVGPNVSENGGTSLGMQNMFTPVKDEVTYLKKLTLGPLFKYNGSWSDPVYDAVIPPTSTVNWYTQENLSPVSPDVMKITPGTYYADIEFVRNMDMIIKYRRLEEISNAVNAATGTTGKNTIDEIINKIKTLGGGV